MPKILLFSSVVYASSQAAKPFKEARVLVIGGGYGGINAALKLKDQCNVTLIDARNAFHHNMGAQRSAVQKGQPTSVIDMDYLQSNYLTSNNK